MRAPALKRAAATQQVQTVALPAPRGTITDRNGAVLAVSEPASDVSATPYLVREPLRVAAKLAPLLGVDDSEVLGKLSEQTGFVYLARRLPAARADRDRRAAHRGHHAHAQLAPHLSARAGSPRSCSATRASSAAAAPASSTARTDVLRGQDGIRRVVSDALGQPISIEDERPTVPGRDVELTLDANLQDKVESVLDGVGQVYRPRGATAIVMNPQTSEILALANWPRVNANDPGGAPPYAQQNRAVGFTFEPGSTFKAFTVAGALEDRASSRPTRRSSCPHELHVADRTLHDAEAHGDETLTVAQILRSSRATSARCRSRSEMGARRFSQWVDLFGFGRPTGVDLPGEEQGIVPTYDDYSGSSIANLPIGQGQAVTPMQMMAAYAAIANGGILRTPQIVRAIDGSAVRKPRRQTRDLRGRPPRACARCCAACWRPAARPRRRASRATTSPARPAPPTRSTPTPASTPTRATSPRSWASRRRAIPSCSSSVVVDEPQGAIYGGQVAAPAFQKIVAFALPYLGIRPS